MVQYGRGDNMKIISTLLIVSLLFVPSFAEGGKEMAVDSSISNARMIKMIRPDGRKTSVSEKYVDQMLQQGYTIRENPYFSSDPRSKNYSSSIPWTQTIDYSQQLRGKAIPNKRYKAPTIDYEAQLKALKQAQYEARANALKTQKNTALSSLDAEKSTISPMYYDKRNQAAAQSDIGALNFAQFMASRGVQGNAGAMPEVYRNAALQGQIGALNQQEASDLSSIENRRSDIIRAYESDLAAAKAETEAQALQAIIEQQRIDQQNAIEQERYDATQAKAADVTAYNRLEDKKAAYAATVGQFSGNYKAEMDRLASSDDPDKEWKIDILAAARQKKIDDAMAKWQKQGYVSEDIAAALGLEVGTMTEAYKLKLQDAARQAEVQYALKLFEDLGRATPEIAAILARYGLPSDAMTLNALKTQYSINKPYTGGSGVEEKPWYLQ